MKYPLTISLVIWNGARYLEACFESLLEQTNQDYFLLISDNGSADESVAVVERYLPRFEERARFIKHKENLGFAKGHNRAMHWSDSPYFMLLNQDIMLDPRYVEEVVSFMDKHPKAGAVSGKILQWKFEAEGLKSEQKSDIVDSLGLSICRSQKVVERHVGVRDEGQFTSDEEVFGVSGTVPVYRRSALEAVRFEEEFLDEDFFSYKEDVDLAYRLRWNGWEAWVVAGAVAFHDRSAKSTETMSFMQKVRYRKEKSQFINYHSYKNQLFLLVKNIPPTLCLRQFIFIKWYELKKFLYILFFEPKTLGSLGVFFKKLSRMMKKRRAILGQRKISIKDMIRWYDC